MREVGVVALAEGVVALSLLEEEAFAVRESHLPETKVEVERKRERISGFVSFPPPIRSADLDRER